jgi:hypothetical protein
MTKNYDLTNFESKNKKGTITSETIRAIANQNQFLTFAKVNQMYAKFAKQYKTNNVAVLVKNGLGKYSTLKAHGSNMTDLTLDDTDYYQKYDRDNRQKFNKFVQVDFVILKK